MMDLSDQRKKWYDSRRVLASMQQERERAGRARQRLRALALALPKEAAASLLSEGAEKDLLPFNLGVEKIKSEDDSATSLLVSVWPAFTTAGFKFSVEPIGTQMGAILEFAVSAYVQYLKALNMPGEKVNYTVTEPQRTVKNQKNWRKALAVNNFPNLLGEPCMAEQLLSFSGENVAADEISPEMHANFMLRAFASAARSTDPSDPSDPGFEFVRCERLSCRVEPTRAFRARALFRLSPTRN